MSDEEEETVLPLCEKCDNVDNQLMFEHLTENAKLSTTAIMIIGAKTESALREIKILSQCLGIYIVLSFSLFIYLFI